MQTATWFLFLFSFFASVCISVHIHDSVCTFFLCSLLFNVFLVFVLFSFSACFHFLLIQIKTILYYDKQLCKRWFIVNQITMWHAGCHMGFASIERALLQRGGDGDSTSKNMPIFKIKRTQNINDRNVPRQNFEFYRCTLRQSWNTKTKRKKRWHFICTSFHE